MPVIDTNQTVAVFTGVTKSRVIAYLLWGFLGLFGGHRFYLGSTLSGLVQMLFTVSLFGLPVSLVWWVVDAFRLPNMLQRANQSDTAIANERFVTSATLYTSS